MKYFKTALPVSKVRDYLKQLKANQDKDVCIVEIENKKSIIVTISETIADYLQKDRNFSNIKLSDIDISVIKIVHKIRSVTGNPQLF